MDATKSKELAQETHEVITDNKLEENKAEHGENSNPNIMGQPPNQEVSCCTSKKSNCLSEHSARFIVKLEFCLTLHNKNKT